MHRKWETAAEWLPTFLVFTSAVILIVGLTARYFRTDSRGPAGFVEVSDSDDDSSSAAAKIYADESAESLNDAAAGDQAERTAARKAARNATTHAADERIAFSDERTDANPRALVVALKERVSESEIQQRTGVSAVRARAVLLSDSALIRQTGVEIRLQVDLFADVSPTFLMKSQSAYDVNRGMLSGSAPNDSGSRAEITYDSGMVSGFIVYRKRNYRIVADPSRGLHYILEVSGN